MDGLGETVGAVYHTDDGGATWIKQFADASSETFNSVHFINEQIGWVGGYNGSIYHTDDGGQNWSREQSHTTGIIWTIDFIDETCGWAIGDDIMKWEDIDASIQCTPNANSQTLSIITLEQNFPNPFNTSTMIRFSVHNPSYITLSIFNVLGQKIDVLIDEIKSVGNYRAQWNAEGMPSGIYFFQLSAIAINSNNGLVTSQIRKIVLSR